MVLQKDATNGFALVSKKESGQSKSAPVPSLLPTSSSSSSFLNGNTLLSVTSRASYSGAPSFPGWKDGQFGPLTNWAVNDKPNRPVICEYEPDATWLWTKWRGTVLYMVVIPVLWNMAMSLMVDFFVRFMAPSDWPLLAKPPMDDPIVQQLQGVNTLWAYQVTLCTFILTFFTAEAYKHWRSVYFTTRAIQGRINDVCLLVTVGANRLEPYSEEAQTLVNRCTRLIKKSHTFFWAATPTSSNGVGDAGVDEDDYSYANDSENELPPDQWKDDGIGPLLLSEEGLSGLVAAGELTSEEAAGLIQSGLPPSQYAYILLEWVGILIMNGFRSNLLVSSDSKNGTSGLQENLLRQLIAVRAEYFSIGDYTAGRMPLAYVQLVQVLVDSLVFLAPLALYSELGTLSAVLAGLLTLFFKGLLELSKSFLDPFGNEGYPGQNIRVDVLVSELNYGASSRWVKAAQAFPDYPE